MKKMIFADLQVQSLTSVRVHVRGKQLMCMCVSPSLSSTFSKIFNKKNKIKDGY